MQNNKRQMLIADFALLIVALFWGGGFIAVKDGLKSMAPMHLLTYRFLFAAIFVFIFFFKKMREFTKYEIIGGITAGFVLATAFAFQTFGLKYIDASKQGFLTSIYVIVVPLISWLIYRKAPERKTFYASFIAILGIGLISFNGSFVLGLGELLTLISAFFFALHIITLEYFTKRGQPLKLTFLQLLTSGLLCLIITVFNAPIRFDLTLREWSVILYLSLFSTFLCFTIQTVAQKYTSSSHASIMMSLESVFAALLGVWLLGETMTIKIIIGCSLVFIAILVTELKFKGTINE